MELWFKLILASTLISLLFSYVGSPFANDRGSLEDQVRAKVADAFESVAEAERAGGDVSRLVEELNEVVRLLEAGGKGELEEAESRIADVMVAASEVKQRGIVSTRHRQMRAGCILILLAVSAAVVWRFGRMVFWLLWLRFRRDWRALT